MNESSFFILLFVSATAGSINAVAGGGTLLTFPILVQLMELKGTPTADALVLANGTNTIGLFIGPLASVYGYRQGVGNLQTPLKYLAVPSIIGGALGAYLLTNIPANVFSRFVPWLVLFAALIFLAQPKLSALKKNTIHQEFTSLGKGHIFTFALCQFFVAIYGGYFGAGIGILMLAYLGLIGFRDIHAMNAVKCVLGFIINAIAAFVFIIKGNVDWSMAILMMVASSCGGYIMAKTAVGTSPSAIRKLISLIGVGLSVYYFIRL